VSAVIPLRDVVHRKSYIETNLYVLDDRRDAVVTETTSLNRAIAGASGLELSEPVVRGIHERAG
jgi:hypothetical protein